MLVGTNPKTQRRGLLFPTHIHTKTETKRTIKIKNPKNNIERTKKREKRKPARNNRDKMRFLKITKNKKRQIKFLKT